MIRLHTIGVRVYYEDTDAGGIVYYANYLRFFERARTDWLRAAGITQQELSQVEGLNLVVRECAVQYLRPARLDDLLAIEVGVANPATDIGRASLRFAQRALRIDPAAGGPAAAGGAATGDNGALVAGVAAGERLPGGTQTVLATATVRIACLVARTGKPAPLPQAVAQAIAAQVSGTAPPQALLRAGPSFSRPTSIRIAPEGTAEEQ